jgi:diketogulonate reductase-like aldo/keto reductase
MENYILNNGVAIPKIGLGTWHNTEEATINDTVREALAIGYTHIDTAAVYGNEQHIGKALKECGVPREQLFITSKVWKSELGYGSTLRSFEKSLNDLKLDYIDLYLIHWPASPSQRDDWAELNAETWHALEDLYKAGKVRAIGVSNFWQHHLEALLQIANIKPMINQIEHHPGYRQQEVVDFCKQQNILVEAWSPLGRGMVLNDPTLSAIAQKYGATVAQICVAWCLQEGILPLPKSAKRERLVSNLNVDGITLSQEDIDTINALDLGSSSGSYPDSVTF